MKIRANDFNSYQDFVNFISEHPEIKSRTEFKHKFSNLYSKFIEMKFKLGHPEWELPIETKRTAYNLNLDYSTLEDFQNFINENDLHSSGEFKKLNKSLHSRMARLGFAKKVIYVGKANTWLLDSPRKIQKFIIDNNIESRTELKTKFIQVWRNMLKIEKETGFYFIMAGKTTESRYEKAFKDELESRGITNYKTQVWINDNFRVDFIIDDKIIIEIHGEQHFDLSLSKRAWNSDVNVQDRDKLKKEFAIENGYKYYYFTYAKDYLERFGYFDKVFTDLDELFAEINIFTKRKEQILHMESFLPENEIVDISLSKKLDTLEKVLKFLQDEKICSPEQLKLEYRSLYATLESKGWIKKLYYYIPDGETGSMKNYRSVKDVQNLIIKLKILNRRDFRKRAYRVYNKAWRFNWLSQLKYYSEKDENLKDGEDE